MNMFSKPLGRWVTLISCLKAAFGVLSCVLRWTVSLDLICIQRATEKTAISPGAAKMMTAWLRPLIQKRLLKRQVMGLSQTDTV